MPCLVALSCRTLCNLMDYSPPRSSVPGYSLGKNTGMGCHALLQGIFLTQGSNPGLPRCRWILYHLSHQGRPRILEWVAYLFSRGYSQPRNQTRISWIEARFFTSWATREAHHTVLMSLTLKFGLKSGSIIPPDMFLFLKIVLAICSLSYFHTQS